MPYSGNVTDLIVHLDLKGAPLKLPYLEKVLILAKEWGATGILFEWEDTFPYTGDLIGIGSLVNSGGDGMYSKEEIQHVFQLCDRIGLKAIQLIQTIGHMEFVLKHEMFKGLREDPRSPAVLCPSKPESKKLVETMLKQALNMQLEVQPHRNDVIYLHIGADEVWHSGICPDCQHKAATSKYKSASLILDHIRLIYNLIRDQYHCVSLLMWDDMLRAMPLEALKEYCLGDIVQPVLWHYNAKECFQIDPALWDKYRQSFSKVWAGSAFKGANGSCQIVSPASRYISNHEAWIHEAKTYSPATNFVVPGFILTGWSRFDHYATLCELLPVSLPTLASCLRLLKRHIHGDTSQETIVSDVLPSEQWPGEELARSIHAFTVLREQCHSFIHGDLVATWLNPWQLANNYTNPVQIEGLAITAQNLLSDLSQYESVITPRLLTVTGTRSTNEWVHSLITPLLRKLTEIRDEAARRSRREASVTPV